MKKPTRSPTHADIDATRLASMGLELEDVAEDGVVTLKAMTEHAEDRGRPVSHYLAALTMNDDVKLEQRSGTIVKICAGSCQQWGALDLLEHLASRNANMLPVACLDRCDQAPACELHGDHGVLVIAPATAKSVDDALAELS
ncbi:MAG: hypothetical protein QM831_40810 [Kofleriaceae bacterium]